METVRINALMFRRNGTFVELTTPLDEFWVLLSPTVGYARFVRMGPNRTHVFELREVRPASAPIPSPQVTVADVLWSQRAATTARQASPAYRQAPGLF